MCFFFLPLLSIFIPRHTIVVGCYGFTLVVRESVRLSVRRTSVSLFFVSIITCVNINEFSPNLVYALILCRLGLIMGKFRQFLMELSARDTPIFSFPDDNLTKHQWIFTKLGMCIHIVEIWFGIANGQILSYFDGVICPRHANICVSVL